MTTDKKFAKFPFMLSGETDVNKCSQFTLLRWEESKAIISIFKVKPRGSAYIKRIKREPCYSVVVAGVEQRYHSHIVNC